MLIRLPAVQFTFLQDDIGVPLNYRHMEGFGVHTFTLINKEGKITYVKFHWKPTCGVKNLLEDEAIQVGGSNHSHATAVCIGTSIVGACCYESVVLALCVTVTIRWQVKSGSQHLGYGGCWLHIMQITTLQKFLKAFKGSHCVTMHIHCSVSCCLVCLLSCSPIDPALWL